MQKPPETNFLFTCADEDGKLLALCADPWVDPDLHFNQATEQEAVAMCEECPLKEICLKESLVNKETYGVWGGVTESARQKLLKRLK